jgi:hypothetical protein
VELDDRARELFFERLNRHAAAGNIDYEELEHRVVAIDAARTREEAIAVFADLPKLGDDAPEPPGRPRWGHGHADADEAHPDWRPTAERFRDPRTNKVMRVWEDSAGGRHYVAER